MPGADEGETWAQRHANRLLSYSGFGLCWFGTLWFDGGSFPLNIRDGLGHLGKAVKTRVTLELVSGRERRPVDVEVLRRRNARRIVLKLRVDRVVSVTAPPSVSLEDVFRFVRSNAEWVLTRLSRLVSQPFADWLARHGVVRALEQEYAVDIERVEVVGDSCVEFRGERLRICGSDGNLDALAVEAVRQFASVTFAESVRQYAFALRLPVERVAIRDQRSRWGSCSRRKTISLNWRAVLLPAALQRYLVLHEFAHLIEMNHSADFWTVLEAWDPDARQHDAELAILGREIMGLGRLSV